MTVHPSVRELQQPMRPHTIGFKEASVPKHIQTPPYAFDGNPPPAPNHIILQDDDGIDALRISARLARKVLDKACAYAKPGITTEEINSFVHQCIIDEGAYPSPLNYVGFPKSVCTSINEVICHGEKNIIF
jgi:methionyl aminopeptidase